MSYKDKESMLTKDVLSILENILNKNLSVFTDLYFKEIIWGKNLFEKYLLELLPNIACSLVLKGSRIKKIIGNQEQEKLFSVWCKND